MKMLLIANTVSLISVILAAVLMWYEKEGYGWLILIAALGLHTWETVGNQAPKSKADKADKSST